MARSKETYGKKENEKKKQKKRQEKEERKEQRKSEKETGKSLEDMLMYVDENGNLTPDKPDPSKRIKIRKEDIVLGVPSREQQDPIRRGRLTYFDESKGYGFISERDSDQRIFVHVSELRDEIRVNDKVTYELGSGPKGVVAVNVELVKL